MFCFFEYAFLILTSIQCVCTLVINIYKIYDHEIFFNLDEYTCDVRMFPRTLGLMGNYMPNMNIKHKDGEPTTLGQSKIVVPFQITKVICSLLVS